jgi:aquaporin Z
MPNDVRRPIAEFLGTMILVVTAVGVATLTFGFKFYGENTAIGVLATSLSFGFVVLAVAYAIGPISGCHVNPAVTLAFVLTGRMSITDAIEYWLAQLLGGLVGSLILWGILTGVPTYSKKAVGLGTNGYGARSLTHISQAGAFGVEIVLTFMFVLVVLGTTRRAAASGFAGLAVGLALTVVHLVGIPLTGTSVNPARSFGPAAVVGGGALSQMWLFILAPLAGGALASLFYRLLYPVSGADPKIAPA